MSESLNPLGSVLLVEDSPDDAVLTVRAFNRHKFCSAIDVVTDGLEALDFLFARGMHAGRKGMPLPRLVVLDLNLPKLDGIGVLRAIREEPATRLLPVVVLTSSRLEQDLTGAYTEGANSFLVKPIDFVEFVESARVLGHYWLTMNQHPPALRKGHA
jgi:two-component system response regulator